MHDCKYNNNIYIFVISGVEVFEIILVMKLNKNLKEE